MCARTDDTTDTESGPLVAKLRAVQAELDVRLCKSEEQRAPIAARRLELIHFGLAAGMRQTDVAFALGVTKQRVAAILASGEPRA